MALAQLTADFPDKLRKMYEPNSTPTPAQDLAPDQTLPGTHMRPNLAV